MYLFHCKALLLYYNDEVPVSKATLRSRYVKTLLSTLRFKVSKAILSSRYVTTLLSTLRSKNNTEIEICDNIIEYIVFQKQH